MDVSRFYPGQEVTVRGGQTGVLYARTWPSRKGPYRPHPATWFFLPDGACAVGLVVMNQPHEICDTDVAEAYGQREGTWPAPDRWLSPIERQQAYVAHMQGKPLPVLAPRTMTESADHIC
jgi:hypothetical protein